MSRNIDPALVESFGREWSTFDQTPVPRQELERRFTDYFGIFPFAELREAEGFDLGCGSGRWAALVAPKVGRLHYIDPSGDALEVARRALSDCSNAIPHQACAETIPLEDASQDFGYSIGVLHHVPHTEAALRHCIRKLRTGAPFLVYLYYDFENRPWWFRATWRATDLVRRGISRLPFRARAMAADAIAAIVYWPLARMAKLLERFINVGHFPLSYYRNGSFYTMRTDALDRFGTRLEQRFSRAQIKAMMEAAGLRDVVFSDTAPYWVAWARKA